MKAKPKTRKRRHPRLKTSTVCRACGVGIAEQLYSESWCTKCRYHRGIVFAPEPEQEDEASTTDDTEVDAI